jgi:release factor glutamine methyltransferase
LSALGALEAEGARTVAAGKMTGRDLVKGLTERLAAAGIEAPRAEAWLLLAAVTGRSRAELMAGARMPGSDAELARLDALAARRCRREPMAYVLGEKEFWSLTFRVGPAVLVPRPESETVVEAALGEFTDRVAPLRLLDLGTGSGCLLLALLSELPKATGIGVDTSRAALAVAEGNAADLGLGARASFAVADWGAPLEDPFDLIVTNPPYVREAEWTELAPEIRDFEPRAALVAGADGLDAYRTLAPHAARLLAEDGVMALEIGRGQGDAVAAILAKQHLEVHSRHADLAGIERCLVARHRR